MTNLKPTISDGLHEEYYQISSAILSSFPKYRPPLDLFKFDEDACVLQPYFRKNHRLTNEQVEEVAKLCKDELLFVSRADHPVYAKHIVKQVDLILVDRNLKEGEIVEILIGALQLRIGEFFQQPVQPAYEAMEQDLMVFTEYLFQDKHRIKAFMRRLLTEHTLVNHAVNSLFTGLWILFKTQTDEIVRRKLDRTATALVLHDVGMVKVPPFIQDKPKPMTNDETSKMKQHIAFGGKMLYKLGVVHDEAVEMANEHHERLDGSGYPRKMTGSQISHSGQLCAVADSFAAMVTERPWAPAMVPVGAAEVLSRETRRYNERMVGALHAALATREI